MVMSLWPRFLAHPVVNTPLEPLRPTDVLFGGYKTDNKDLGGILPQNRFLAVVTQMETRISV